MLCGLVESAFLYRLQAKVYIPHMTALFSVRKPFSLVFYMWLFALHLHCHLAVDTRTHESTTVARIAVLTKQLSLLKRSHKN